jgi:alpha-tubulin suppressor-like RCC1 family protein
LNKNVLVVATVVAVSLVIAACNDNQQELTGPGFICDITNPVEDLSLSPQTTQLTVRDPARASDNVQLTATATNRFGVARTDVPISFSSSDTSVAVVDSLGLVTAKKPGVVTIKASTCGKSATSTVTIVQAVASVSVEPATKTLVAGDSVLITAQAVDQTGKTLTDVTFTFSSSSSAVTIVQKSDSTALVFANVAGDVSVTATGEGSSAISSLTILPRVFLAAAGVTNDGLDVGGYSSCGLISQGRVYCWGLNSVGQLGATSDTTCFGEDASSLPCSLLPLRADTLEQYSSVSVGDSFACGIGPGQRAFCWGAGGDGQLGTGTAASHAFPTLVTSALTFTSISAGGAHTCGLAPGGGAYCWGKDSVGQLGDARQVNSTTPIPVFEALPDGNAGVAVFVQISAGAAHTCAVKPNGQAFCWGDNASAQLGDGTLINRDTATAVAGGLTFKSVSSGGFHTCGVTSAGAAYCWGRNTDGELGTGSAGGLSVVPLAVAGGLTFDRVSSGEFHTCGLTTTGAVYCWGRNFDLQLGIGPATGSDGAFATPQLVALGQRPAGVTFTSVSAGRNHSCSVGSDGAAYCWGSDVYGALGNTLQAAFRGVPQRVATPQ